jgi:hypothetical protein
MLAAEQTRTPGDALARPHQCQIRPPTGGCRIFLSSNENLGEGGNLIFGVSQFPAPFKLALFTVFSFVLLFR